MNEADSLRNKLLFSLCKPVKDYLQTASPEIRQGALDVMNHLMPEEERMLARFFVDRDWDVWTIWACCRIVMAYPLLAEQCKWEELQGKDWVWLLQLQPELAVRCNWNAISTEDWQQLQEAQPQLYEKWHIDQ